jgi:hypothetical protein
MICQVKPLKTRTVKIATNENTLVVPDRAVRPEELFWSPMMAGPYIVPVSRWIE